MKVEFVPMGLGGDWDWFNRHNAVLHCEDTSGIIARDVDTGERYAGCALDNWTQNSVQAHLVITNPQVIKHGLFSTLFEFIFVDCDRQYMYGMVPSDNTRACKLNQHLGFKEMVRLPNAYAKGVDYVIMELKRENCRFINQNPQIPELKVV